MEAKNLRVGNYILHPNTKLDIVKEIFAHERYGYAIKTENCHLAYYMMHEGKELIEPVPVTAEWLEKFGFINDKETGYRWFAPNNIDIAYDLDDNCIRISDSWEFGKRKYVHELQNLFFALTGTELELKNEYSTCG